MPTEDEAQLPLVNRFIAAAGAAVVAAVVVNPLDVIKTRIQAQAMAQASGRATPAATAAVAPPSDLVHTLYERWGICETPLCVRRTPAGLTCSNAVTSAAATMPGGIGNGSGSGGVSSLVGSAGRAAVNGGGASASGASAAVLDESILHAMRSIARTEGLSTMWRGTGASLAVSVPMVGIYMPLYDYLLHNLESYTGVAAAPIVAGSAARTMAVFAVAPFELLRTRLQATPHSSSGTSNPLRMIAGSGGAAAAGVGGRRGGAAALSALRSIPVMWTGLSATLLRDVPFSALYWALVEPIRGWLLPPDGRLRLPGLSSAADVAAPATGAGAAGSSSSSGGSSSSVGAESSRADSSASTSGWHVAAVPVPVRAAAAESPPTAPPTASAVVGPNATQSPRSVSHHTPSDILAANMISGFVAGGLAAAATTPFDVVKTRMQIAVTPTPLGPTNACDVCAPAAPAGVRAPPKRGVWSVMREVYTAEGLPGLFAGVKPRAYRAAPACAIVISCYELLKRELTPA